MLRAKSVWIPPAGTVATYLGRSRKLSRTVRVVAEASAGRLVVEAIGHVWPDPFAVAPPCCPQLSFDEALLASIVRAAGAGDRIGFDVLTGEMLGSDARAMLFTALENFVRAQATGSVGGL